MNHSRRMPFVSLMLAGVMLFADNTCIAAQTTKLSGQVVDADDQPVANAIVRLTHSAPIEVAATRGQTCAPECAEFVTTDEQGHFVFTSLPESQKFRLALAKVGYEGVESDYLDPADNGDRTLRLVRSKPDTTALRIEGRVVDAQQKPIPGTVVRPYMVQVGNRLGGNRGSVTSLAITDSDGKFALAAQEGVTSVSLRTLPPVHAPNEHAWRIADHEPLEIVVQRGASLRGRILDRGQPVSGLKLGLTQADRTIGNIVTPMELATDQAGFFQFDQLPPDMDYALYSLIDQNAPVALPVSLVAVPASGKRAHLGDISGQPINTLKITIETVDGANLPGGSIAYLSRDKAWQSGRFQLEAKPRHEVVVTDAAQEDFQLNIRIPGYEVARTEPQKSVDINRRFPIRVAGDTEFKIFVARTK